MAGKFSADARFTNTVNEPVLQEIGRLRDEALAAKIGKTMNRAASEGEQAVKTAPKSIKDIVTVNEPVVKKPKGLLSSKIKMDNTKK